MPKKRTPLRTFRDLAEFADECSTKAEAARRLSIVPSYLTMLLSGARSPSLGLMERCAKLGIPMDSWRRHEGKGAAA